MVKFRVWDRIDKTIKRVYKLDFAEWFVGTDYEGSGERNSFNNEETDRHILMQYTGLKDKNATEIYEGDILFLQNWNDHIPKRFNIPLDETREVIFKDGSFCVTSSDGFCTVSYINKDYCEVIGNIYENKELLNERN